MQAVWSKVMTTCPASTAPLAGSKKTRKMLPHHYLKPARVKRKAEPSAEDQTKKVKAAAAPLLTDEEQKILNSFDLNPFFGPGRSISRLDRYARAIKLNIQPPPHPRVVEIELKRLSKQQC